MQLDSSSLGGVLLVLLTVGLSASSLPISETNTGLLNGRVMTRQIYEAVEREFAQESNTRLTIRSGNHNPPRRSKKPNANQHTVKMGLEKLSSKKSSAPETDTRGTHSPAHPAQSHNNDGKPSQEQTKHKPSPAEMVAQAWKNESPESKATWHNIQKGVEKAYKEGPKIVTQPVGKLR